MIITVPEAGRIYAGSAREAAEGEVKRSYQNQSETERAQEQAKGKQKIIMKERNSGTG